MKRRSVECVGFDVDDEGVELAVRRRRRGFE